MSHDLYVIVYYPGHFIYYTRASDDSAETLNVTHIAHSGNSWATQEQIAIKLTDDYLRAKAATGFTVRVSAQNGSGAMVVEVPGSYIRGHLLALAENGFAQHGDRIEAARYPGYQSLGTTAWNSLKKEGK